MDRLEADLLTADVGLPTTLKLLAVVERALRARQLQASEVASVLGAEVGRMAAALSAPAFGGRRHPQILLLVGVNGVGKTTTAAKIAHRYRTQGHKVLLAACDTFRAAGSDQLQTWGKRLDLPVVAHKRGSDAAAVAFEALQKVQNEAYEVLIVDTAGRLHTKRHLMDELAKIERVLGKKLPHAHRETLWVLDATHGQNGLAQAQVFVEAVKVTGVVLTKMDGHAKGGLLLPIMDQMKLAVRYIGIGESLEALTTLDMDNYISSLFGDASPHPNKR